MPTPNFNLPLINGASPISIVNDMNALATACDSALGTLPTSGDIASIKNQAETANANATAANKTAQNALSTAQTASSSAATANSTANSASNKADNAQETATNAKTAANDIEAHTYFTQLGEHSKNPWGGKGAMTAYQSNDGKMFYCNGCPAMRPTAGGIYATSAEIISSLTNMPSGGSGIPLFVLKQAPIAPINLKNVGIQFFSDDATAAFSFNYTYVHNLIIDTDGIVYMTEEDYRNRKYSYGLISTGTQTIRP